MRGGTVPAGGSNRFTAEVREIWTTCGFLWCGEMMKLYQTADSTEVTWNVRTVLSVLVCGKWKMALLNLDVVVYKVHKGKKKYPCPKFRVSAFSVFLRTNMGGLAVPLRRSRLNYFSSVARIEMLPLYISSNHSVSYRYQWFDNR